MSVTRGATVGSIHPSTLMGSCVTTTLLHRDGIAVKYVGTKYMSDLSLLFMGSCVTTTLLHRDGIAVQHATKPPNCSVTCYMTTLSPSWAIAVEFASRTPYRTEIGLQFGMSCLLHWVSSLKEGSRCLIPWCSSTLMGACDTTTLSHRVGIAVWYEQVTTPGVGQCTALGVGYVGLSKYMSDLSLLFMGACDTTWALATTLSHRDGIAV